MPETTPLIKAALNLRVGAGFDVYDKSKCISCMRCVSICPVHARSVNKVTLSVVASAIKKACSVQKSNELFL